MVVRVPAVELNPHPSSPFTAPRCRRPGDAALPAPPLHVASRMPRRPQESKSNRIIRRLHSEFIVKLQRRKQRKSASL
ncbi:unnamed protein product [Urochloa humidicola]